MVLVFVFRVTNFLTEMCALCKTKCVKRKSSRRKNETLVARISGLTKEISFKFGKWTAIFGGQFYCKIHSIQIYNHIFTNASKSHLVYSPRLFGPHDTLPFVNFSEFQGGSKQLPNCSAMFFLCLKKVSYHHKAPCTNRTYEAFLFSTLYNNWDSQKCMQHEFQV